MGESAYEMQLECNPNAAIANAIYGKQMDDMRKENRIRRLAVVADVPLYVFFDIGHSLQGDDWTMWVMQFDGRDVLVHRYHARTGELPAYYANVIFGFESELRARVHTVYLPHDGTRQDRHGASAKDDLEAAGLRGRVRTVARTPKLWDSINDVRAMLARVHIDQEGCGQGWTLGENEMPSGIDCLDFYTKKVEAQTGMITEIPVHNQYSHGADAFRTFVEAQKNGLIDGGMSSYERGGPVHSIKVSREANPYQQAARRRPISVR
jgi:phage terminase large subunit